MAALRVEEPALFSEPFGASDAIHAGRGDEEMDRIMAGAWRQ
jgi:hypothetical protein